MNDAQSTEEGWLGMTDELTEQPARESQVATHTDPEVLCDYLNLFAGTTSAEQNRIGDLTAAMVMRSAVLMIQGQRAGLIQDAASEIDSLFGGPAADDPTSPVTMAMAREVRLSVTVGDVCRARTALEESK